MVMLRAEIEVEVFYDTYSERSQKLLGQNLRELLKIKDYL